MRTYKNMQLIDVVANGDSKFSLLLNNKVVPSIFIEEAKTAEDAIDAFYYKVNQIDPISCMKGKDLITLMDGKIDPDDVTIVIESGIIQSVHCDGELCVNVIDIDDCNDTFLSMSNFVADRASEYIIGDEVVAYIEEDLYVGKIIAFEKEAIVLDCSNHMRSMAFVRVEQIYRRI